MRSHLGWPTLEVRAAIVLYINSSFLAKFLFPRLQNCDGMLAYWLLLSSRGSNRQFLTAYVSKSPHFLKSGWQYSLHPISENTIMLFACPPKFYISIVFVFSRDHCPKRNWKQCLRKIWRDKQRVLWYFSKWLIVHTRVRVLYGVYVLIDRVGGSDGKIVGPNSK